uniref:flavin reductase family protein n=1 Tax=uncultured Caulobacter sp. TaxID=158749 RepID=UPI0025E3C139|nr:flavin reductase family protein [uncultured Caulobacter sp.]
MGQFATGVGVVTYHTLGGPKGMTANAFLSVSLDPPLVLVSVRKRARVLGHVAMGDVFGINILAHDQAEVSDYFGGRGGAVCPAAFRNDQAAPLLAGCLAWIVARVVDLHPAGDHRLMIGRVQALEARKASPLLYHGGRYFGE